MKQTLHNFCSRTRASWLAVALVVALTSMTLVRFVRAAEDSKTTKVTVAVSETPITREGGKVTTSFAPVVKKVAQSIVQINVSTKSKEIKVPAQQMPFGGQDPFQRFFGNQFGNGAPGQERTFRTPGQSGLGSGVIISKDGYILTNNHVVDGADTIQVVLTDGREFTAKVIGRDPKTDVAVVKIDGKDLPFVTLADSDKLEVGDLCLAIGNPFGIGQTVTMGIISATGRANVGVGDPQGYEDFIQTDAAINPGNSGGALVDAEGRLIGINTAILSRSGGNQGIGFAVPVNLARNVMESLVSKGKVVRGYLGLLPQDVTPALAEEFKLKDQRGALVAEVNPKTPAEKAGLKDGDVIIEFDGKPVSDARHLRLQVAETDPGTTAAVKVIRDGKEETLSVKLGELPGTEQVAQADSKKDNSSDTLNGVTVANADPQVRRQMNVPAGVKGAVVTDVDQDSAAYQAGIRPGFVIEEINHTPVHSAEDAVKLTENAKERKTLLKVWGNGGSHYVVVDESKAG
jgi:serine protease Do